jgi:hypothetical protein
MDEYNNIKADEVIGDLIIEVKRGIHSARDLRAALLQLSYQLVIKPDKRGLLVLVNSRLTKERLDAETNQMRQVMRNDILDRIYILPYTDGSPQWIPSSVDNSQWWPHGILGDEIEVNLSRLVKEGRPVLKPRDSYYSILQALIVLWIRDAMPITRTRLMEITGMSYPTVAKALGRLGPYLADTSDRSVVFEYFPRDEWKGLLAVSSRVRSTKRFAAPQGIAREVEQMIFRLRDTKSGEIGIGGVAGAEHYYPELDIVGLPRLDLSVVSRKKDLDLDFVMRLDPALEPVKDLKRPADLVVHLVTRKESLFVEGQDGRFWADPVECLLDLHESGFSRQGDEMLDYLEKRRHG